jgi:hypothetical protein
MTATATATDGAVVPASPAELASIIRREVRDAVYPTLTEARKLIGEAEVPTARANLGTALKALEAAQAAYREAQAIEGAARETWDQAVLDAEWQLDGRFVVEGTKTFLVTPCEWHFTGGEAECPTCGGKGERRAMTADERKAWKASEARKLPEVADAQAVLRRAGDAALDARDAVGLADKRISVCKHELDASVAVLACLTAGLAASDRGR